MIDKKQKTDLSQLDSVSRAEAGAPLEILHPVTGDVFGITITLCGADSKRYRDKRRALMRERIHDEQKSSRIDLENAEQDAIAILAACTLGWAGMEEQGKAVPFSEAKAVDVYTRYPVIREQVSSFVENRANFLPKLPRPSAEQ